MIKKYKNEPICCNAELYQKAIEEYSSIVSKYKEVKSIIQIGNVGVAGISDIDLIVYLDENLECDNNYSLYQIDSSYHHILMHDVFIIPVNFINQSYLVTSIFDTKTIYGRSISNAQDTNSEKNIIEKYILLNDQAVVSLLHEYEHWDTIKTKDIKLIIARLNSIKYPIMLLTEIAKYFNLELKYSSEYNTFIEDFSLFRKNWFNNTIKDNLTQLDYFIKIARNNISKAILSDMQLLNHKSKYYTLKSDVSLFNNIRGDSNFFINLHLYAKERGPISTHIKVRLEPSDNVNYCNELYLQTALIRMNIINNIYTFRKKNNIYYGELWTFGKTNIPFIVRFLNKVKRITYKLILSKKW